MTNPVLRVEMLSLSTERHDRGEKADHDRRIPSLRDYVLVSQHTPRVEIHAREGDLTAMPGALAVDRVYQGVELTPATRFAP